MVVNHNGELVWCCDYDGWVTNDGCDFQWGYADGCGGCNGLLVRVVVVMVASCCC